MLTVTTAADKTDLVSLGVVKSNLRLEGPSEDSRLEALIAAASATICDHVGFQVARQRYTLTVKSYGDVQLLLPIGWIDTSQAMTVTVDGEAVTDFTVEDAEAGILLREAGWPWSGSLAGVSGDRVPGSEIPVVTVVSTHGWAVPGQTSPAGSATLPDAISRAAFETVKDWWLIDQRDPAILSRTLPQMGGGGNSSISYASSSDRMELPPIALALLRKYRGLT